MSIYLNDLEQVKELQKKGRCLHTDAEVRAAITRMAEDMTKELADTTPIFLCVMNGAVIFMGQLLTQLNFPLQINYIHATRYHGEIEGRELHWRAEPTVDLKDRTIVVVEDILDTGLTLAAVVKYCEDNGAKKVYTAALVDKQRPRELGGIQECDFTGLVVENKFLYGYGLDFKDFLRNEAGIYAVED